jgi:hypothetical protein
MALPSFVASGAEILLATGFVFVKIIKITPVVRQFSTS